VEQALTICIDRLGADHPDTRTVCANLESLLSALDEPLHD
jgi:hypothetical protein